MGRPRKYDRTYTCIICSCVFERTSIQCVQNCQTCSYECKCKYYSICKGGLAIHKCEMCGKETKVKRWYIKQGKRFCGDECRLKWFSKTTPCGEDNLNWKGGNAVSYYGKNWFEIRRLIRIRDNNTCQKCKKTASELGYNMIVHHKVPFKKFGKTNYELANKPDNLICYCRSCHLKVEWKESKKLRTKRKKKGLQELF